KSTRTAHYANRHLLPRSIVGRAMEFFDCRTRHWFRSQALCMSRKMVRRKPCRLRFTTLTLVPNLDALSSTMDLAHHRLTAELERLRLHLSPDMRMPPRFRRLRNKRLRCSR